MSRSLSWIEPGRLAAALREMGDGGVSTPLPSSRPPVGVAPLSLMVAGGNRLDDASVEPAPQPLAGGGVPEPTDGQALTQALESFCDSVRATVGARTVFVVDEAGLEVISDDATPELMTFSSTLCQMAQRLGSTIDHPVSDSMTVESKDGELLHLLTVGSSLGRFVLGFTSRLPTGKRQRDDLRRRLLEVLDDLPIPESP